MISLSAKEEILRVYLPHTIKKMAITLKYFSVSNFGFHRAVCHVLAIPNTSRCIQNGLMLGEEFLTETK